MQEAPLDALDLVTLEVFDVQNVSFDKERLLSFTDLLSVANCAEIDFELRVGIELTTGEIFLVLIEITCKVRALFDAHSFQIVGAKIASHTRFRMVALVGEIILMVGLVAGGAERRAVLALIGPGVSELVVVARVDADSTLHRNFLAGHQLHRLNLESSAAGSIVLLDA